MIQTNKEKKVSGVLRHWIEKALRRNTDRKVFEYAGLQITNVGSTSEVIEPKDGAVYFAEDTKNYDVFKNNAWRQGSL